MGRFYPLQKPSFLSHTHITYDLQRSTNYMFGRKTTQQPA